MTTLCNRLRCYLSVLMSVHIKISEDLFSSATIGHVDKTEKTADSRLITAKNAEKNVVLVARIRRAVRGFPHWGRGTHVNAWKSESQSLAIIQSSDILRYPFLRLFVDTQAGALSFFSSAKKIKKKKLKNGGRRVTTTRRYRASHT